MAKFSGRIGFVRPVRQNGVYTYAVTEKKYYGDILQNHRRWDTADKVNDDLDISNRISILANDFLKENIGYMKYAEFMGQMWEIKSFEIAYPRVILLLGGVYNGPQASTAEGT